MFKVISDGVCDFSADEAKKSDVDIVPFYINLDGTSYREGIDINKEDYFKRLIAEKGLFPKTSQPTPQDFMDVYTPHLKAGNDLIVLTVSSKLSGSYQSATLAASNLKEEYPDREIVIVDSLNGSVGQGLILKEIVRMRDAGLSLKETADLAEKILNRTRIYFTLDNLEYLKRGGRVGPTQALVGGLLKLRPILHVVDGQVVSLENVRGKKNALKLIEQAIVEALKDDKEDISINIGHILSEEDAGTFKSNIEAALGIKIDNPITEVGATIGTHAGPGAFIFAYCRRYETL